MRNPISTYPFAVLFLCVLPLFGKPQTKWVVRLKIDSLVQAIARAPNDTSKVKMLNEVSFAYFTVSADSGIMYGQAGLKLAQQLHWQFGEAKADYSIGANYWARSDFAKALSFYLSAVTILERIGDRHRLPGILLSIGDIYQLQGNYDLAFAYQQKAKAAFERIGDQQSMLDCLVHTGQTYYAMGNIKQALSFYLAAYNKFKSLKNKDTNRHFGYLSDIADLYKALGDDKNFVAYKQQALSFSKLDPDKLNEGNALNDFGDYYLATKKYKQALSYFTEAWVLGKTQQIAGLQGSALGKMGKTYLAMAKNNAFAHKKKAYLAKAVQFTKAAIASWPGKSTYWYSAEETYLNLWEELTIQGNYKAADSNFQQYLMYHDSTRNNEKEKAIIRQGLQYEFSKKQDSLTIFEKLQNSKLLVEKQQAKLDKIHTKQQWLYVLLAAMVLLGTGVAISIKSRMQLDKEKAQQQIKDADYQNRMNDITFAALRSQMNPHFIFNCLNSIKLYTEQNNNEAASSYLGKFAQLIRSTLNNARQEKIILSEEIAQIELYLQLEAMRFKEKLTYTISLADDVDLDFIEIPPMLVQPYIENAIWHGLMHKKEGGHISLHFSEVENNSALLITIADNGIGRQKSAELKSKTAEKNKSYGITITGKRIELINEKYGTGAEVKISDLYNENNEPSGTLVAIKLPIQ